MNNITLVLKRITFLILGSCCSFSMYSQGLIGAWQSLTINAEGHEIENVVIFSEEYQVSTKYQKSNGAFISTNGGSWSLDGNTMTEVVEFNSANPESVGSTPSFEIQLNNDSLQIVGRDEVWRRIDAGAPGDLQGAWLMSGRVRNNETTYRNTDRPRKTMKILSGTRFQWIAYNTETKEFKGTGGGIYTTIDGKYKENIVFFSRDNSKVGMSLEFDYDIENNDWQHRGFSSKGDPMHEIWSRRK